MKHILEVKNLHKRYYKAKQEALAGLNLVVREGDFFGLLGQNGSGKTTLLSIVCGLLKETSGEVLIAGQNYKRHQNSISQQIALVPQEIALYPSLTLYENLNFFGRLYGLDTKHIKYRIQEVCELVRLHEHQHQIINTFSGGMKRRANLAISLLHEPKLLLLDEPTVHVDPHSRQLIFEGLKELNQQGTTIVYTTHYMEEIEKLCNQMVLIDYGKKILEGNPRELIQANPDCKDLNDLFLKYVKELEFYE